MFRAQSRLIRPLMSGRLQMTLVLRPQIRSRATSCRQTSSPWHRRLLHDQQLLPRQADNPKRVAAGIVQISAASQHGDCRFACSPPGARGRFRSVAKPDNDVPFEEAMQKLENIVDAMESGELPLETLMAKFEEGTRLAKICQGKLAQAEVRIQQLEKNAAGELTLRPVETSNGND